MIAVAVAVATTQAMSVKEGSLDNSTVTTMQHNGTPTVFTEPRSKDNHDNHGDNLGDNHDSPRGQLIDILENRH